MPVEYDVVTDDQSGQRLDNFLIRRLKGVPKSRIYKAIRQGEVRINRHRAKADTRVTGGDEIRIPPIRQAAQPMVSCISASLRSLLESRILIENNELILIHKPCGLPVHGGSSVSLGLIEALRQMRANETLELVHRLDKETSGCLLIAKKRSVLRRLQAWFKTPVLKKRYWVLVKGHWTRDRYRCDLPLIKNQSVGGERIVRVSREGKPATTVFRPLRHYKECTLLEATLKTGRTHQIRVHLQALSYPVAGDDRYGDRAFNQQMRRSGLNRLFLQSMELSYRDNETLFGVCAMLDEDLASVLFELACHD